MAIPDENQVKQDTSEEGAVVRYKHSERVVSYLPDNSLRTGFFSLVGDIVRELIDNRWLTYQLFRRDIFAFYKQSLLGAIWIIVVPLITVGTFILLRSSGVVATGEIETPYPLYAGIGVTVWQLFAQGLVAGSNSLVAGADMITRINFSKKSLVLASMGRTLVAFLVLVGLVLVLFVVFGLRGYAYTPTAALLLVPLALIPIILLTLGLSFWLALLNALVRDIATMMSVIITFFLFLTPILYERPVAVEDAGTLANLLGTLTDFNPLYYLVVVPRDLILIGSTNELSGFLISSAVAIVLFIGTLFAFHLTETRVAERI